MAQFGYFRKDGAELILCKQSTISYPLHNHVSVCTLGFVLEGAIELGTDESRKTYRENEAFIILPYAPHCINAKPRYTLLSLCVSARRIADPEFALTGAAGFLRDSIRRPAAEEKILRAWSGLLRGNPMPQARNGTAVGQWRAWLETRPEGKCGIEEMAKAAFMSQYHFIRAFKREVGLTPHQFRLQNRVRKAQRLLEGQASITEVALAAGFCDQSHFIRHFRKIVGLTPTEYKTACAFFPPVSFG